MLPALSALQLKVRVPCGVHSAKMPVQHSQPKLPGRPELQERIERLRKKLADRKGNKVVVTGVDTETFEAIKQTEAFSNVCQIGLYTGRCCGIVATDDCAIAYPCPEPVDPDVGFAFCCVEHQKTFECNLSKSVVSTFYDYIATINIFRPELEKRFYTDWLPCTHIIIAKHFGKALLIASETDEEFAAYSRAVPHAFEAAAEFRNFIRDDIKKYWAFLKVSKHCETAFANAVYLPEERPLKECPLEVGDIFILSPAQSKPNTPRSAQQSPRNSPRTAKQSPRQPSNLPDKSS